MGNITTPEVLIMLVIAGWLIFNAGFVSGAAWKANRSAPKHSARPGYLELDAADFQSRRSAPRCHPRVRV